MNQDMWEKMKDGLTKYAMPILTRAKGPRKQEVRQALEEAASEDKKECK